MQNNREIIILAAIEQFNIHGIQGASIAMIAKASHISKGTVYYYYQSKDDLIEDAFAYVQKNAREMSLRGTDDTHCRGSPEKAVKRLVRDSLLWPLKYPEQLRFMDSYLNLYFYKKQVYRLFQLDLFDEDKITQEMRAALKPRIPLDLLNFIVGDMLTNFAKYIIINPEYSGNQEFVENFAQAVWDLVSRACPKTN
jgi:AcrR family transcriptional regulator